MISVIIPMYNVEQYILSCLESLGRQTYSNFEVIVVDDGSSDGSIEIVKKYRERSEYNINLICQKNQGVSVARNKGFIQATGDYVCFVDSDDMVAPTYLESMLQEIEKEKADLVICGVTYISEETAEVPLDILVNHNRVQDSIQSTQALQKFMYRDIKPGIWSILIRKSLMERNNLLFAEGYKYSEDIEIIYKLISHSKKVILISDPVYIYRIRNTSAMSRVDSSRLDGFKLMKNLEKYFAETNSSFSSLYKNFGVARWVWATTWQMALACKNYKEFQCSINEYNTKYYMKKLIDFPKKQISISARIFSISPYFYYKLIKMVGKIKTDRKFIN